MTLELLKSQLEKNKLPQAYLFSGNDEDAKEAAILFLVTSLLGKNYQASPDFYELVGEKGAPIAIDDIRQLIRRANLKPFSALKSVFLLKNIENLSREAAPALLKILEDPPEYVIILATTSNFNTALTPIKSRFSRLHFPLKRREVTFQKQNIDTKDIARVENELKAQIASADPTINKRLVEEYLNLVGR